MPQNATLEKNRCYSRWLNNILTVVFTSVRMRNKFSFNFYAKFWMNLFQKFRTFTNSLHDSGHLKCGFFNNHTMVGVSHVLFRNIFIMTFFANARFSRSHFVDRLVTHQRCEDLSKKMRIDGRLWVPEVAVDACRLVLRCGLTQCLLSCNNQLRRKLPFKNVVCKEFIDDFQRQQTSLAGSHLSRNRRHGFKLNFRRARDPPRIRWKHAKTK